MIAFTLRNSIRQLSKVTPLVIGAGIGISSTTKFYSSVMAQKVENIYGFKAQDIDGNDVSMEKYKDHVCIIVNVASK
nr:putative glutathione peroxidase 7, chloroplastic [Lepeophtheirus salmonis]